MPKEVIQTDGLTETPVEVVIKWGIDTYVQVATVHQDGESESGHEGWYCELNRYQINQMIRILRKARDQAFGADE